MTMVPQNLISALAFWDAKENQTFRRSYCGSDIGAILCRYDRLLPFIIMHTPAAAPNFVYLVQEDGTRAINLGPLITVNSATIGGVGYLFYEGSSDINQSTSVTQYTADGDVWDSFGSTTWGNWVCDGGKYYIEVSAGSSRYRSELMQISDFPEEGAGSGTLKHTRIEAINSCPVGNMPASMVSHKLFIEGHLNDPAYLFDKEVAKDGQEEEAPVWVKFKKRYKITFLAIETVADFMASLLLYDLVLVTDLNGWKNEVTDKEVDVSWPEDSNGCVAQIEFSFSITYLSQTGCC